MEFAPRSNAAVERTRLDSPTHRCPQCRVEALVLSRRHVSPARLGEAMVTEYYDCDCCDAQFQFAPAENRWKPVYNN